MRNLIQTETDTVYLQLTPINLRTQGKEMRSSFNNNKPHYAAGMKPERNST